MRVESSGEAKVVPDEKVVPDAKVVPKVEDSVGASKGGAKVSQFGAAKVAKGESSAA